MKTRVRKNTEIVAKYLEVNPGASAYRVAKDLNLYQRHTTLIMEDLGKVKTKTQEVLSSKEMMQVLGVKTITPKVGEKIESLGYRKVRGDKFPFAVQYVK